MALDFQNTIQLEYRELDSGGWDMAYPAGGSGGGNGGGDGPGVPTGLNVTGTVGHGNSMSITDSVARLGVKEQAAPRYWIFGDEVYIDGTYQDDYAGTASEQKPPTTPYLSMGSGTDNPVITESRPYRHSRINRHFHGTGRTHTGHFENLKNEAVSAGTRNGLYASWWMRFGFNPGFGSRFAAVDSISGTPDYGADHNDADGEEFSYDGSTVGKLIGHHSVSGDGKVADGDFVAFKRYTSSFNPDGATITGNDTGATITFQSGLVTGVPYTLSNMGGKTARTDPQDAPQVVSIGVAYKNGFSHFIRNAGNSTIYTVFDGYANVDAGDSAVDDTGQYDDRDQPFPRWGHFVLSFDYTGDYLKDKAARDYKNLKYSSSYETLIGQNSPPEDEDEGLVPASRASATAPPLINIGFEPGGSLAGIGNVDFSEIYVDRTPRRVVLGNADSWDKVTRVENQRATSWDPQSIDFVLNMGGFGDSDEFWIYIMNDDDEPVFDTGISRTEVGQ